MPRSPAEVLMGKGVVSIRVEALGVSITIADGDIAIEQTKTEIPAVSKAEGPAAATSLDFHVAELA
jgi:hypothetical protein